MFPKKNNLFVTILLAIWNVRWFIMIFGFVGVVIISVVRHLLDKYQSSKPS